MMKTLKHLFALACFGSTVMATASVAAQTLTLSNWVPPTHFVAKNILTNWAEQVHSATEGRIAIKMLPKAMGSPPQHFELARKGLADVTWGNFTYEPERFKMLWFAELPKSGSNSEAASVALWRTYDNYLRDNPAFDGVVILGVGMLGGGQFNHPSKVITSLSDLKGQKVRMGGPIQKRIIESLGAVPVSAPATKAYELLEGGAVDASLHGLEAIMSFRLDGALKTHTIIPDGLYDGTFFVAMNEKKFKALSSADQEAILRVSGEVLSRQWGQEFDRQNASAKAALVNKGHRFAEPDSALSAMVEQVREELLSELAGESSVFGVEDHAAMVSYYRAQYLELAQ